MLYQLLTCALVVDIPLTILRVMEIDVTIDILRMVAVFVVAVVIPKISVIDTLT
jgi:hypothetical protein